MSKNKFEVVDYEDVVRLYDDKCFIGYSLCEEGDEPKLYYIEGYNL